MRSLRPALALALGLGWLALGCSQESLLPGERRAEVPPLSEPLGSSIAEPGKVRLFVEKLEA